MDMTTRMQGRTPLAIAAVALTAGVLLLSQMMRAREPEPVEVRLVARDMAFQVDGRDALNPVLRFKAGQRVRLTLVNADRGIAHDFTIPPWNVRTPLLDTTGEASVEFVVPSTRGTAAYSCTPHARMMRGTIEVE